MKRTFLALICAAGVAAPAIAQQADVPPEPDCAMQVNEVRAQLDAAQVPEEQRAEIDAALMDAEQAAQAGDEDGCVAIVQQVQAEIGLQ